MDRQTLEKYQPKLARLFLNSRKTERLSNAYLLYGPKNAPLKEIALYLAQSLECENDFLGCNHCPSCLRFKEGIHPDFHFIDGQEGMIKKDDIAALEKKFSLSAVEKGHRLCYVIHRTESLNGKAANSLLKFLEEPKTGQIAFLTSCNIDKILPTIRSRCIPIRINAIDSVSFMNDLLQHEFNSEEEKQSIHLSLGEAYILSLNLSSMEEAEALLAKGTFRNGFAAAEAFLNDYVLSWKTASFTILKETAGIKDTKCYNWMYLTIQTIFEEVLINDTEENNPFREIIAGLQKHTNAIRNGNETIKEILSHRYLNYNPTAALARFLMSLEERNAS